MINLNMLNINDVYLVFRGTKSKEGIVARNFNLYSDKPSHVGIAIYIKDEWKIYHVVNSDKRNSAFKIDSIEEYFYRESLDVDFVSIYRIINFSNQEKIRLNSRIEYLQNNFIYFDLNFSDNGSDNLYCSEMVVDVLNKVNPKKFNFKYNNIKLNQFQSRYLRKDSLHYYPVDIFQNNSNFQKIIEYEL